MKPLANLDLLAAIQIRYDSITAGHYYGGHTHKYCIFRGQKRYEKTNLLTF